MAALKEIALFGFGLWALSCASPQVVKTALGGDLAALKREVASARKAGGLDEGTVRELAIAVLRREIQSMRGEYAPDLLASFSECVKPVISTLEDRAATEGDVAAAAQLLLLSLDELDPEDAISRFSKAEAGAFRAVAARASVGPEFGKLRREFLLDPDPRVRKSALKAALAELDPADIPLLFESSRVDPDPGCRSLAIRALGLSGGERAVRVLRDRFEQADESTKMAIAEAWSLPKSLAAGGDEMLVWLAQTGDGLPAVTAAVGLGRHDKLREVGTGVLLRLLEQGTSTERRVVVQVAPLDDTRLLAAVRKVAANDADVSVRAQALIRLLSLPGDAEKAKLGLVGLLADKGDAALIAEQALARHGDQSVAPRLLRRLQTDGVEHRQLAAFALLDLQRYSDAADGLADAHPKVRASVACEIVRR